MKKTLLLLPFLLNTAYATQLFNYQDTIDAVQNGKKITYVVDWDKCKLNVPDVTPNLATSYSPDHVIIDKSGFMGSRGMKYSHIVSQAPKLGPVNQAFVYKFTKDNELHVTNRFLDPVTFNEKMPAIEAVCQLNDGFKVFAD
jgi:hypothetical protein